MMTKNIGLLNKNSFNKLRLLNKNIINLNRLKLIPLSILIKKMELYNLMGLILIKEMYEHIMKIESASF